MAARSLGPSPAPPAQMPVVVRLATLLTDSASTVSATVYWLEGGTEWMDGEKDAGRDVCGSTRWASVPFVLA